MALSNIRREPQREITESLIGLSPLLLLIPLYYLAQWLMFSTGYVRISTSDHALISVFVMLGSAVGIFIGYWVIYGFLHLTHDFGEGICGWLEDHGWDPRPKDRR